MRRRAALLALVLAACGGDAPTPTQPDLVLVVIDTLRADRLGSYGYGRPTSPALDALAASGALFEDCTAQSSWTLPSMASLLSGRELFVNAKRMPDGAPSLAARLAEAGYETAAFVANPAISSAGCYDRGFSAFVDRRDTGDETWTADELQRHLFEWLDAHPRDGRPRFLYLHFLDPHYPYAPRDETPLAGQVALRDDVLEAWVKRVQLAPEGDPLRSAFDQDRKRILADLDAYDREIRGVDHSLAAILERLDEGEPARERLVVVAADHGEGLWDHEHHAELVARLPPEERTLAQVFFRDHSYHLFRELVRTPLIVAGAGFAAGRHAAPVANVDIAPTLLRAAGLPDDPELDGRALQDVVAGRARPRGFLFAHCQEGTLVRSTSDGWSFVFPSATGDSYGMPLQLYDLAADPHERSNLAGEQSEILRKLIKVREAAASASGLYRDGNLGGEDDDTREVLEQMGYVGAGGNPEAPPEPASDTSPGC